MTVDLIGYLILRMGGVVKSNRSTTSLLREIFNLSKLWQRRTYASLVFPESAALELVACKFHCREVTNVSHEAKV